MSTYTRNGITYVIVDDPMPERVERSSLSRYKQGASRLGISVEEYTRHVEAVEKWCAGCHGWHDRSEFGALRSKPDGLAPHCRHANVRAVQASKRRKRGSA